MRGCACANKKADSGKQAQSNIFQQTSKKQSNILPIGATAPASPTPRFLLFGQYPRPNPFLTRTSGKDTDTAHIKQTQLRPVGQCHYIVDFSRKKPFTSNPTALHDWQYEGLREKSLNCVGFAWTKEVCMFVCLTAYFVNIVINTNILIFIKI